MTATLAASAAIVKVRYPDGTLPKSLYLEFKATASVNKKTDFTGDSRVVALQNENPQGSSADFPMAQGSLQQGVYNKFTVTRVSHYGIVRIKGEAMKAAEGQAGALVDLWKNELDGAARVELMNHEIYTFGSGNGILGRVSSGEGTVTITLTVPSDAAKFALGMRVQAVSDTTYSTTVRGGGAAARITGIDRASGTLTIASAWTTAIPGLTANDYLVRAGDASSAGSPSVIVGMKGWIPGGTAPGTLYGLNRNTDPVRLAGQSYNAASVPLEEAIQEVSALQAQQGGKPAKVLWCHLRDFANLKKALGTKVTYPKGAMQGRGGAAGIGFTGVEVEGDSESITIMTSPFIDRNGAFLVDWDSFTLDSLGPAPTLANFDKQDMLRIAGDDAYEARFVSYASMHCNNPVSCVQLTNFGA